MCVGGGGDVRFASVEAFAPFGSGHIELFAVGPLPSQPHGNVPYCPV
jgi:hypothetical protein